MPIGLGIGLAITRGATPGFSLTAPVLAFASATDPDSDNTQDLVADFSDTLTGYVIRVVGMRGTSVFSEPYDVDANNPIDSAENTAGEAAFAGLTLSPDGVWYLKSWVETAGGARASADSNVISKTIDTSAAYSGTYYYLGF